MCGANLPRRRVQSAIVGQVVEALWHFAAKAAHERHQVGRPAARDGRGREDVLEEQIPADNPRHELAHRQVRVQVGGASKRETRGKLGVREAGEDARESRDEEGNGNLLRGGLSANSRQEGASGRTPGPA